MGQGVEFVFWTPRRWVATGITGVCVRRAVGFFSRSLSFEVWSMQVSCVGTALRATSYLTENSGMCLDNVNVECTWNLCLICALTDKINAISRNKSESEAAVFPLGSAPYFTSEGRELLGLTSEMFL